MNKIKKAKGPIRFEAIIPLAILFSLIWVYFYLFFDSHLKWGVEYGLTRVNGAEVNVGSIKTSFVGGSFELRRLQVTKSDRPEVNSVEIGRIHFKLLWDALLRMKFVIDDASVEHFQVNTPRSRKGYVLPQPVEPELANMEAETQGSALAEAGQLIQGAVPSVNPNEIGQLKSLETIKNLQKELEQKQSEWNQSLASLPTQKDLSDLRTRVSSIRVGGTSDPVQIQKQISDVSTLVGDINQKTNDVKTKADNVRSDINRFQNEISNINKVIDQDVQALESKLKLPRLDVESLTKQFFGPEVLSYVQKGQKYIDLGQKYMPPRKSKEERRSKRIEARERQIGRNIEFPKAGSYPMFWLKRAALSSKADGSPFGGNVVGEILNFASHPPLIGRPAEIKIKGDFPNQKIVDINFYANLDHTKEIARHSVQAKVGSFPVMGKMLSQSDAMQFGFKEANGQIVLKGQHQEGSIELKVDGQFDQIDYIAESANPQINEIVKGAIKDLKVVRYEASVSGPFSALRFGASSDLGIRLQQNFERQFKGKLDEAKKKLEEAIHLKIGGEKKQLTNQFSSAEGGVKSQLDQKTKEIENVKSESEKKLADAKKQAENQGRQVVDDLKKKFGF